MTAPWRSNWSTKAEAEQYVQRLPREKQAQMRKTLGLDSEPETQLETIRRLAGTPAPNTEIPVIPENPEVNASGFVLDLPWPPSSNNYYPTIIRHRKDPQTGVLKPYTNRVVSEDGRKFLKAVHRAVIQQGSPKAPFGARITLIIELHPKNKGRMDIDNRVKPVQDALTKAGVWEDDCLIDKLIVERKEPREGGACRVTVIPQVEGRLL